MKRIFKFILSMFLIMIILCNYLNIYSLASQEATIQYKEDCGSLIKRNGAIIKVSYVVFNNNGIESPVYCLNKDKPGVGEVGDYNVNIKTVLKDTKVWRAIKNGYPYKTPTQLNCENYKEAYTATKMAVYAMLYNYTIDNFEPIGEAGQRTYKAIKTILENANNSLEKPFSSNINIIEQTENWTQDENNKNNVYKLIRVKAESIIKKYNVYLGENYPEGIAITDKNNNYKESFIGDEEFKISVPIKQLKENGIINLKVVGELENNPIYIGESLNPNNQDYAITKISTEEGIGEKNLSYSDNKTKIRIIKKDEENNNLKNAVFELLDQNKNTIMSNLATNENGEIVIENLIPGRYYIKEIVAPAGYKNYDKSIEVNVKFNEELSVIIKNSEEDEPIVEIERDFIEINSIEEEIKLPKTGM